MGPGRKTLETPVLRKHKLNQLCADNTQTIPNITLAGSMRVCGPSLWNNLLLPPVNSHYMADLDKVFGYNIYFDSIMLEYC